jgi:hypothetical protein
LSAQFDEYMSKVIRSFRTDFDNDLFPPDVITGVVALVRTPSTEDAAHPDAPFAVGLPEADCDASSG